LTDAVPKRAFRDPLQVLIGSEHQSCKGCRHEVRAEPFGKVVWVCTAKNTKGQRLNHGTRCKEFG